MMPAHIADWDVANAKALRSIWMCGDIHNEFKWLARTLLAAPTVDLPSWIVFLGDLDLEKPFDESLAPLHRVHPEIGIAYIPGNHDADSYEKFDFLTASKIALNLHGKVTELNGIRVAGLGGNFLGRVWYPPAQPKIASKEAAINRGAFQFRGGQRPSSTFLGAIYQREFDILAKQNADILITHEAGGAHHHGFEALDVLSMDMQVKRHFHGHHHDNRTAEYRQTIHERGVDMVGVSFCGITNGLGEVVFTGPKE